LFSLGVIIVRIKPAIGLIIAAAIILVSTEPTSASDDIQLTDGTMLLHLCEAALNPRPTRADFPGHMYVMGYIRGFTEAEPRDAEYDIPPGVSLEQAVRVIKKWLDDHPQMLDRTPRELILRALKDAYPAKRP
jgi:hypothetical protein